MKKKIILFALLVLFFIYIIWLSVGLLSFKAYKSPELKEYPLQVEGAYHFHSLFSDGKKSIDEVAKIASQASLDFIILTDHGSPNHESYASQGWKEGVLVLAGSELSVSRGHLVALGFELPKRNFSQNTEHAVYEIEGAGGFSIIAHPYSKTKWSWGELVGYSGIEIMNADSMIRINALSSLPYIPAILLNPEFFLLKSVDNPVRNLRKWDELNKNHPLYSYFSTDAHLFYRPLFDLFHLHLQLESSLSRDFETAKEQVFHALRKGIFYNSIHAAADASGFRFWGEQKEMIIPMGGTASLDSPVLLNIQAPFSFSKEIHLIRDGKVIFRSTEESASYLASQPGAYRVEVYLKERTPLRKNIPWIVSNPIFLREDKK